MPVAQPLPTLRPALWRQLAQPMVFDVAVVGGGATGLGVALDAAVRGLKVVLLESHDFAHGTSSRSTKLVHGGVRYLAQGELGLVREALRERAALLHNAPHLAQPLPFVMPAYRWWERPFYGLGLLAYDVLAGHAGLGRTRFLSAADTRRELPHVQTQGLRGGVRYWDGQFDDARLALALARTAAKQGALLLNHVEVTGLSHAEGRVNGLRVRDALSGDTLSVQARCVVNATGVWVDTLRAHDALAFRERAQPAQATSPSRLVEPSQGVHLVVDRDFLPGGTALMVPKTADGRVLFAVPWLGKLVLGTTDTPRTDLPREPRPFKDEVDFILNEAGRYLAPAPTRADVRSAWVGLRPLVKPVGAESAVAGPQTRRISREHTVQVSPSGLVTVTGGKWTTYRAMAEDVLAACERQGLIPPTRAGLTRQFPLVGAQPIDAPFRPLSDAPGLHAYGSEAPQVAAMPGAGVELAPGLTEGMVRFAARYEYALTVEDVLARRSRLLFLDARLAASVAERVGDLMAEETGGNPQTEAFMQLARQFLTLPD